MISCPKNIVFVACIFALLLSCQSRSSLAQSSGNGGGSGSSLQANADVSSKGLSGSAQAAGSVNGAGGSLSAGANASASGAAGAGGGGGTGSTGASEGSASAGASLNIAQGSSSQKPDGVLGKIKEVVKGGVDSMTSSKKSDNNQQQQQQGSASASASLNSGDNQSQSSSGLGLTQKLGDAAKKAKDLVKEGAKEVKDDVKAVMGLNGTSSSNNNGGLSASGSVKLGGGSAGGSMQLNANAKVDSGSKSENPISKLLQKVGNKASEFTDSTNSMGAGNSGGNGGANSGASANANAQVKVNMNGGNAPDNENKSLAVNLADKVHEFAKAPVEAVMKPLDKALGFDKDPLIKMYDDSHELIRKPLSVVAKPVESVFSGAFKTSEEARQEQEQFMSEQERRDLRSREEEARKEGRSVLGDIVDRAVDLAGKPYEIILKPVDKILGFDKEGQKGPLIKMIDEIYNISRKPIDAFAKPFENILKKMADGDQAYQVSVRLNSGAAESSDPKLLTRLADGALNIADRVVTKPLEIVMRPLGYDGKKKNPIVESTHQLKNATKLGVELFTRPFDRILKEISDIGANKSGAERDAERERRLQEASRLVKVLDKLNQAAQMPWEIVLRPISRATGYSKEGKREPFLRAWDILHQVVRTPIQIVSKPVEDAILGERKSTARTNAKAELKLGGKMGINAQVQVGANGGAAGSSGSASFGQGEEEPKKNIFVDNVKRMEKMAVKPFDKLTSPIRRLILGEDDKVGSGVNAKASVNTPGGKVQVKAQMGGQNSNEPDKIMKHLEKMNNVLLKPFEVVSQPIADLLDGKKGAETKAQAQASAQSNGQQGQNKAAASVSAQLNGGNNNNGNGGGSGASGSASGSANVSGTGGGQINMSASAAAQAKQTNSNNSGNSNNGQNNMSASGSASAQFKKN